MSDFLTNWKNNDNYYEAMEKMATLTKLFNNYEVPYLDYHFTETCFCYWFGAQNVSIGSTPFDAVLGDLGIGLKTFIYGHKEKREKVSEFNKIAPELKGLSDIEIIRKISALKNERLIEGMKKYNVVKTIYFCIARRAKGGVKELIFFPYNYSLIDIPNITITESTDKKILFNDGKDKYNFNFSKSTLYQYFSAPEDAKIISFEVYPDPWLKLITPETQTD